jgi:hypothetical protein
MAKFSKKMMGKEVGDASVYAAPHDMKGKNMTIQQLEKSRQQIGKDPNTLSAKQVSPRTTAMRVSAGDPAADDVKTSGIKIRGTGAATKGLMARGPMA